MVSVTAIFNGKINYTSDFGVFIFNFLSGLFIISFDTQRGGTKG